jgi:hypothetical protein
MTAAAEIVAGCPKNGLWWLSCRYREAEDPEWLHSPKGRRGRLAGCLLRAIRGSQVRDRRLGRPQGPSSSKLEPINDPGAFLLAVGYAAIKSTERAQMSATLPTSRQAAPFTSTPAHFSSKVSVAA